MIVLTFDTEQFESIIKNAIRSIYGETMPPKENKTQEKQKEILTVEEAAEFLNIAKQTVYTLTSKREIPHFKRGKKLYFKLSELIQWIERDKRATTAELKEQTDNYLSRRSRNSPKS